MTLGCLTETGPLMRHPETLIRIFNPKTTDVSATTVVFFELNTLHYCLRCFRINHLGLIIKSYVLLQSMSLFKINPYC